MKKLDKELKHYLGALAENYNENLKTIKEGSVFVVKNIEEINKKLNQHTEILDNHTQMFTTIIEDIAIIKGDLKKKVDYDEFLSLVRRVQKIETKR